MTTDPIRDYTSLPNMGHRMPAVYNDIPSYLGGGSPYIDALPAIPKSSLEIMRFLTRNPTIPENVFDLPLEHRIAISENLDQFYYPSNFHIKIFRSINNSLRKGYKGKIPIHNLQRPKLEQNVKEYVDTILHKPYDGSRKELRIIADAIQIIGPSRIGKSTVVELSLAYNPQVIDHFNYHGQPLLQTQLVYLNTVCPDYGRVKSLCGNVLQQADLICGTNYCEDFVQRGRASVETHLMGLYDLASTSALGMLVVDETQRLAGIVAAKRRINNADTRRERSRLTDELINLLVSIDNILGVPVVYVGTPQAQSVFATHFRSLARAEKLGTFEWELMSRTSDEWNDFVGALASLQVVKKPSPAEDLYEILYECSAGIAGIAIMVFRATQKELLENELEIMDKDAIKTIFNTRFSKLKEPIDALIHGKIDVLFKDWEDLVGTVFANNPPDEDEYTDKERADLGLPPKEANDLIPIATTHEQTASSLTKERKPGRPKKVTTPSDKDLQDFIDQSQAKLPL